jgi:hypothetical protein
MPQTNTASAQVSPSIFAVKLERGDPRPFETWCCEVVWGVLEHLQLLLATGQPHILIIAMTVPPGLVGDEAEAAEATIESLKGVTQSATREVSPSVLWCGLVVVDESRPADSERAIAYLLSNESRFGAGATLDVR